MRGSPSRITKAKVRPSALMRGVRAAMRPSMMPSGAQHAGDRHLGHRLDDARAANAGDAGASRRLGEAWIVRPEIAADHLEARLQRVAVDAQALDGAGRGALAATDLRALEGGAGRRRAGEQARAIAEHDLGIGADIDDEAKLVAKDRRFAQDHGGGVGADMAADARQSVHEGARRDGKADIARRRVEAGIDRQREGRDAELGRVEAEPR